MLREGDSLGDVQVVVGYDGSPPSRRALDTAVRLLQGRQGRITVVFVAHVASAAMLSAAALVDVEAGFDEVETDLRAAVDDRLRGVEDRWGFERRQGVISEELIGTARDLEKAHPGAFIGIAVGSSSHAVHRVVGSVAVSLARRSPVPLIVVP